jgi:hypothetical protein
VPAPAGFCDEVRSAAEERQAAKLILLGLEAAGAPWEAEGVALTQQALAEVDSQRAGEQVRECVVLFTGHRIDSSRRKKPRFPAAQEGVARDAIGGALEGLRGGSGGAMLGIAGGANGGDILFLEVCQELGIATEMCLALAPGDFAKASVENEDARWMKRFEKQLEMHDDAPVLASSETLPQWLSFKSNYDIWQRNNLWLLSETLGLDARRRALIALWDGEAGDGPGGTEHMVSLARERGMEVILLDTKKLFGLEARTAG